MKTDLLQAMIEQCRHLVSSSDWPARDRPESLRPEHLVRMCERLAENLDSWPETKLNRWIGFIQCALIANRAIDLAEAKRMFDSAKNAFGEPGEDLTDHLDPDDAFELDLGGEA